MDGLQFPFAMLPTNGAEPPYVTQWLRPAPTGGGR